MDSGRGSSFLSGFLFFISYAMAFFIGPLSANRVFASMGLSFGRSSREPKFKIEFHSLEFPFHPNAELETMTMSNSEGKRYLCFLPITEETKSVKPVDQSNTSNVIVGTDQGIKWKTPDELIDVLKDRCLVRYEGWWSYEFCYHKRMRQVHLEEEKVIQEFILGEFDPVATAAFRENHTYISTLKDPSSKDASQRYHAHIYTNGTLCDLTNQPRETEVRFVCSESPVMISSIKEISTCKYAVTIKCPLLCKHPMFKQGRPALHIIHCNELPRETKDAQMDTQQAGGKQITVVTNNNERFAT